MENGGLDSSEIFTNKQKEKRKKDKRLWLCLTLQKNVEERETYPVVPGAGLRVTGHADLLTPFTRVAQNPTQITTTILLAMSYAGF